MRKLLLVAALAVVALTAAAGTASAVSFSIEGSPRTLSTTSNGLITFSAAGFITIECNLTLNGSLRSGLIEKTVGQQFGDITDVRIAGCVGGRVNRVLTPLPIRYRAIAGTLPSAVTALEFAILAGFELENGSVSCLYRGEVFASSAVRGANPYTTTGNVSITGENIGTGSGFCGLFNGGMTGRFNPLTPAVVIRRL